MPSKTNILSQRISLRKAINTKCRECIHDPLDRGSAAQQIACCTIHDCPLHSARPITAKVIPLRLLDQWGISINSLCNRARPLADTATPCSVDRQIELFEGETGETDTRVLVREDES